MQLSPLPQHQAQACFEYGHLDVLAESSILRPGFDADVIPFEPTEDALAQRRIFDLFLPLAEKWVSKFLASWPAADRWECMSCATDALWNAAAKIEAGRDSTQITAYLRTAVSNRLLDSLAVTTGVPRSTVLMKKKLRRTRDQLSEQLGRAPTTEEVAGSLGIKSSAVRAADQRLSTPVSIDRSQGGDWDRDSSDDPRQALERVEAYMTLVTALNLLPLRMRQVLQISYFEGRTFAEASRELGVSRARITSLHQKAICRLRAIPLPC